MTIRNYIFVLASLCISQAVLAKDAPDISHGPMLGAVSEHAARIWLRTTVPADVTCALSEVGGTSDQLTQKVRTTRASDNTCIITLDKLKKETEYRYVVRVGKSEQQGTFSTLGPSLSQKEIRIVYGYGYNHGQNKMKPGTSVFKEMASRKANLVLFLGDFPYTARGAKDEVRKGNRKLRDVIGFRQLTSSTPTYGIYDDHDFGPNDCDGTHKNADEALAAFKEYWPNPSYGLPEDKGIYCSFVVGDVEFFLLDGRYPARKKQNTMLGKIQFKWLCDGLKNSESRYKVLVSGVQFGRAKSDGWAGNYYLGERTKLFAFIFENDISGVIGISGDVHRSDIYKLPIGENRYFYDFTPGSLARTHRTPPNPLPKTMIHSYGKTTDNNMYAEIEFRPASDKNVAIIFRSLSAKNGLVYEHKLTPNDLALAE
jgi:alkaline phosphatase D